MPTSTWFRLTVAKRERVLEAAMREFGEHGYSTGSLNAIAREAGIAKGSLFQYFNDKLEFFAYVCDETSRRIREAMEERMARLDLDQSIDGWLFDVLCEWTEYMAEHPLERSVTAAVNFELDNAVRAVVRDTANQHYLNVIHPILDMWKDRGGLKSDLDLEVVASWIMMLLPHLALAPYYDAVDPVFGLMGRSAEQQRPIIRQIIAGYRSMLVPDPTAD